VVLTPHAETSLDGITRGAVVKVLRADGLTVEEADLTTYDLYNADEAFVCGTLTEVVPLVKIDGRQVGSGRPGPITLRVLDLLRTELVADSVAAY
jgi:branched-chain amino acid aminotransferase